MKWMKFVSDIRLNFGKLEKKTITLKDGEFYEETEWEEIIDEKEQNRTKT